MSFPTDSTEDLTPLSGHGGYVASILTNNMQVLELVLVNIGRSYVELRKAPITRQSMVISTDAPVRFSDLMIPNV